MATNVTEVWETAKSFTRKQRADLAHQLLLSLDPEDDVPERDDVDEAWRTEISRRVDDILAGRVQLVSGEESQARVRALLDELHR